MSTQREVLDLARERILRDKPNLVTGPIDQFFPDNTCVKYLNDAQDKFAKRAGLLVHNYDELANAALRIQLVANTYIYPYPESITFIEQVWFGEDELRRVVQRRRLPERHAKFTGVDWWFTSAGSRILTLYPGPSDDQVGEYLILRAQHLPFTRFQPYVGDPDPAQATKDAIEMSIDSDYAYALASYVAAKCLMELDSDRSDIKRAIDTFMAEFWRRLYEAKAQKIQQTHGTEVRPVSSGFL